jgi:DNA polymerase III delta prime subunit
MASPFDRLHVAEATDPPRVLIYGEPGIGKTTLASEFPNPVFVQTEKGEPKGVQIVTFGLLKSYKDVMDAIDSLLLKRDEHEFKTLVVDSVTRLQPLIFDEVCLRGDEKGNRQKRIEDFGYGRGYKFAIDVFREFIDLLTEIRVELGMSIVLLAHSEIDRFDDPESVSYDRYEIDLNERLVGMLQQEMDAILLMKGKVSIEKENQGFNKTRAVAKGSSTIWVHANPKPAYVAKNRYDLQDFIYQRGSGYATIARALPNWLGDRQPQTADGTSA